jgi:hypothetical protein
MSSLLSCSYACHLHGEDAKNLYLNLLNPLTANRKHVWEDSLKISFRKLSNFLDRILFHTVHIYLEYYSDCPLVQIGTTPLPLPLASVFLPLPRTKRGHTRLRLRDGGGGSNEDDWRKSLALCQHTPTQWNRRGFRWSSVEYCTKKPTKIPLFRMYND